jgi:hypothetical protein
MTKESLESFGITSASRSRRLFASSQCSCDRTPWAAHRGRHGRALPRQRRVILLHRSGESGSRPAAPRSQMTISLDVPLQWGRGVLIVSAGVFRETPFVYTYKGEVMHANEEV